MPGWTSRALGYSKKGLLAGIVILLLWLLYRTVTRMISKALAVVAPPAKAAEVPTEFKPDDAIQFSPQPGTLQTVESDRTLDAILRGQYGAAVVMFYADWCGHCKNMQEAFESAAKASPGVAFIKAQGHAVPVSMGRYEVRGYPTVVGALPGQSVPRRFMGARTTEALLEFAKGLALQPAIMAAAPPSLVAPTALALVGAAAVIESVPPTVQVV